MHIVQFQYVHLHVWSIVWSENVQFCEACFMNAIALVWYQSIYWHYEAHNNKGCSIILAQILVPPPRLEVTQMYSHIKP